VVLVANRYIKQLVTTALAHFLAAVDIDGSVQLMTLTSPAPPNGRCWDAETISEWCTLMSQLSCSLAQWFCRIRLTSAECPRTPLVCQHRIRRGDGGGGGGGGGGNGGGNGGGGRRPSRRRESVGFPMAVDVYNAVQQAVLQGRSDQYLYDTTAIARVRQHIPPAVLQGNFEPEPLNLNL
jgi:hypothetical protein